MVDGMPSPQIDDPVEDNDIELPVDQTAREVADILDIDLSECSNADQGTKLVVDALYELLENYQECVRNSAEMEAQLQQHEDEQQELLQQQQQDGEGDPNQEVDEEGNPIDPNQDQEGGFTPDEQPEEDEPPQSVGDTANPKQTPPQNFKKKKKSAQPPIQASFPDNIVKMAIENRQMKINNLASKGLITGEVARQLTKQYATKDQLTLSLSNDGQNDSFDNIVQILSKNGAVLSVEETTYNQAGLKELALEHEQNNKPKSLLVADAESRQNKN